jgi:membrane-associated protein
MHTLAFLGLEPETLIRKFGIIGLALIIFAESGLLIGFFLPGDSLLFTAGLYAGTKCSATQRVCLDQPIVVVCLVAFVAAVLGDQVGYLFGKKTGPALFARPKSRLFKPAHVVKAQEFLDKNGSKTIVMARFVPIVRTFAPIVAGVGHMKYRTFTMFNVIGGAIWGIGLPLLGHLLGNRFPVIRENLELVALIIVFISFLPLLLEFLKHRRAAKN